MFFPRMIKEVEPRREHDHDPIAWLEAAARELAGHGEGARLELAVSQPALVPIAVREERDEGSLGIRGGAAAEDIDERLEAVEDAVTAGLFYHRLTVASPWGRTYCGTGRLSTSCSVAIGSTRQVRRHVLVTGPRAGLTPPRAPGRRRTSPAEEPPELIRLQGQVQRSSASPRIGKPGHELLRSVSFGVVCPVREESVKCLPLFRLIRTTFEIPASGQ